MPNPIPGQPPASPASPAPPADEGASSALDAAASSSSSFRQSKTPRWLGKRVGRYKLISLLGKGAYGRVFLADDTDLQRRVALKIITADATAKSVQAGASGADSHVDSIDAATAAKQAVGRMVREARAAARIEHPNVVQVFEAGKLEGGGVGGYIAMELLDGGTLQDLVNATGPMDVARACTLVADAAEALQHAHDAGVIHRDVKPANLMLSRHGRCKVADFGLAYVDEPSDPYKYARVVGTALYMAPEVALGHPADARSDLYSLAASLFTLLAGRPPYVGDRKRVLTSHVEAPLPDLAPVRPELDPRLNNVIRRAMAKDPTKRFADIRQFGKALRLFTVALDNPPPAAGDLPVAPSGVGGNAGGNAGASANLEALAAAFSASRAGASASGTLFSPAAPPHGWRAFHRQHGWKTPLVAVTASVAAVALLLGAMWATGVLGGGRGVDRGVDRSIDRSSAAYAPSRSVAPAPPEAVAAPTDPWPRELVPAPIPTPAPPPPPAEAVVVRPVPDEPAVPPADVALSPLDVPRLRRIAEGKDPSHPGKSVTLRGEVSYARVSRSGKIFRVFFDGSEQGKAVAVVWFPTNDLFARMADRFGGEAGSGLFGKTIEVDGPLEMFQNAPQITVTSPEQVRVVD